MKKQSSFGDIILDMVEDREDDLLRAVRKEAELEDQIWYYTLLGGDFEKAKKQVSSPRIRKIIEGMEREIEELTETPREAIGKLSKISYDRWMRKVDAIVEDLIYVSVHELVDYDSYGLWQDGISPREAAEIIIEYDGTFADML